MSMARSLGTLLGVIGAVAGGSAWLPAAPAQDGVGVVGKADDFPWRHDLQAARAEARTSGKPLFVRFR